VEVAQLAWREERALVVLVAAAGVSLSVSAAFLAVGAVRGGDKAPCAAGSEDCETPEAFSDGVREMPFGPFLFVPPGSAVDLTEPGGGGERTEVNDPDALAASPFYVPLPAPFTRSAIAGKAVGGEVGEVVTSWDGSGGTHVQVTMTRVDPSELPVRVEWLPITSHLFVRQKVINGRHAVVDRPATCGTETGGWVKVWVDGATLTLASPDAPADDLVALASMVTAPGPLY